MKRAFFTLCTLVLCLLALTEARAQNQIDDTEFFVRQQFQDFAISNPSNSEIFSKISQIDACGTNAACRNTQRVLVSRSLWDDSRFRAQSRAFGLSNTSGLELYDTYDFVELSYLIYLQRASSDPPDDAQRLGFYFWKGNPVPIDDEVIAFLQSRVGKDGFLNIGQPLKPGDKIRIKGGPWQELVGVVERDLTTSERVLILMTSISYQGRLTVDKDLVEKLS